LIAKLSKREIECLAWAAQGKTYQEISIMAEISFGSVKTYLDTARHKLGATNLPHAVALGMAYGFIFMREEAIIPSQQRATELYGEFGIRREVIREQPVPAFSDTLELWPEPQNSA
jgi:DNA-binding CsgD family transcriptional regulator